MGVNQQTEARGWGGGGGNDAAKKMVSSAGVEAEW